MKTITLTLPTINLPISQGLSVLRTVLTKTKDYTSSAVLTFNDFADRNQAAVQQSSRKINLQGFKNFYNNSKKYLKFIPLFVVAIVVVISVGLFLRNNNNQTVLGSKDNQEELTLEDSIAEQELNKALSFPVMDDVGEEVGKVQYTIEKAETRDQLIIKGQQARAIEGREFLILHIKLRNDTNSAISVNTRDFIRLKMKGTDEQFAPTIHNDPVEVQAISTLTTRLGFSIRETDEDLTLLFGEITGEKEEIKLSL